MATPPGVTVNHLTRNYTKANRTAADIVWIVVHDMEMPEKPTTAEACRDYFQATTRQASSHYTIDNNSIVECVAVKDVAWCAPGANAIGIHLEHAGFASQTGAQWLDDYGRQMLARSAALTAWLCDTYRVPKRRLTVAEIRAGKPGIVGHGDLSAAGVGGNTHTDPGPNFPWSYYIGLVNSSAPLGSGGSGGSTPIGGGSTPIQQEDDMPYTPDQLAEIVQHNVKTAIIEMGSRAQAEDRQSADALRSILASALPVDSIAAAVAAKVPGASQETVAAALRDVLNRGVGAGA